MSAPFVAEIRIFACNFAPTGWAQCNGQLLPISQNTALFSLIGTFYGGDGKSTFALPNLQDSVAIHQGQGQGLSNYDLGQQGGSATITLLQTEMPLHTHTLRGNNTLAESGLPANASIARQSFNMFQTNTTQNLTPMSSQDLPIIGGSLPHNNMMPYLVLNYCIAMQGVFPPRP
jgi:microcystin-dependent protein